MNIISVSILAVFVSFVSLYLKKYLPEYAYALNIITVIIIILMILNKILPIAEKLKSLITYSKISNEYFFCVIKSIGICFISQFASNCCSDAGEKNLALKVEFAGKISILLISMPLFEKIMQTAIDIIGAK